MQESKLEQILNGRKSLTIQVKRFFVFGKRIFFPMNSWDLNRHLTAGNSSVQLVHLNGFYLGIGSLPVISRYSNIRPDIWNVILQAKKVGGKILPRVAYFPISVPFFYSLQHIFVSNLNTSTDGSLFGEWKCCFLME